jgi:hypothetical protein
MAGLLTFNDEFHARATVAMFFHFALSDGLAAGQVVLFDAEKGSLVQKLTGHAKKVTSVSLHATKDSVKMCRDTSRHVETMLMDVGPSHKAVSFGV